VGVIRKDVQLSADAAQSGDAVLVNGLLGDHGAAILAARGELQLQAPIESDSAPLAGLVSCLLAAAPGLRAMRDATRGGVATVLNEIAAASGLAIELNETEIPVRSEVRALCELLGLDPLYLANEGKLVAIVPVDEAAAALAAMRSHPLGRHASLIGRVARGDAGRVTMRTALGGRRVVDMLVGEQLPRIC
jgi:hydrogenase expression/formation protein HypE